MTVRSQSEVETRKVINNTMATAAKSVLAGFGEITTVLMRSADYRYTFLPELEWLCMPAVLSGQYSVASAAAETGGIAVPRACVIWAHVSDAVDARLSAAGTKPRLRPDEWTSGTIPWLIDAVGEPRAAAMLLKTIVESRFSKSGLKSMQRDAGGRFTVRVLGLPQAGMPEVMAGTA